MSEEDKKATETSPAKDLPKNNKKPYRGGNKNEYVRKGEENQVENVTDDNRPKSDKNRRDNYPNKDRKKFNKTDQPRPRRNKYEEWEKEGPVTLDTPFPEIPKEKLKQPNNDDLFKNCKEIETEIRNKKTEIEDLKTKRSEVLEKDRKEREIKSGNLKGLFGQVKSINTEIEDLNQEKKLYEQDMQRMFDSKEDLIKQCYGKKAMKLNVCLNQIDELDQRQKTEKLTASEERAILKDLKDLQNSLPIIEQLDDLDKEINKLRDSKKAVGKKIKSKIDNKKELNVQIDEVKDKQNNEKQNQTEEDKNKKKEDRPKHPLTIKIQEKKTDIDNLKDQKDQIKKTHDKLWDAWREQNDLEDKIKWIKRQKNILMEKKREEEYQAEREAERQTKLEQLKEQERLYGKLKKYQPQIDVCNSLIKFLESLKPRAKTEEETTDLTKYNEEDINAKLNSGDWKKEKVHVFKKKTDYDEGIQPGQSKKKRGKQTKQRLEEPRLTLTIETLNFFDSIKVSPPSFAKDLDDTMTKLTDKRDHFIKISDELNEKSEAKAQNGDVKEEEESENNKPEPKENGFHKEDEEEKHQNKEKSKPKTKINLDDEEMFPSMLGA